MATQPPTEAEKKEAEQYWGYMINPDRTGTNNFKNLLRGLHNQIVSHCFPPSAFRLLHLSTVFYQTHQC